MHCLPREAPLRLDILQAVRSLVGLRCAEGYDHRRRHSLDGTAYMGRRAATGEEGGEVSGMHTMAERRAKLLADMRALIPTLTLDEIEELLAMLRARVPAKADSVEAALRGLLATITQCDRVCGKPATFCYQSDEPSTDDLNAYYCDEHATEEGDNRYELRWAAAVRTARAAVGEKT